MRCLACYEISFYELSQQGHHLLREAVGSESPGPCEMGQEDFRSSAGIGADGTIYEGANEGKLCAFSPDGAARWHFSTPGSGIVSSPAIGSDGAITIGSWDRSLYALGEP